MRKVLSFILCLAMVVSTLTDSIAFASNINNSVMNYDPESLMDLLSGSDTGTSIPDAYGTLTPQLPSVPDVSNAQALAEPANNEATLPTVQSDVECPVDTATGNLVQENTDLNLNGIGLNLSIERNYSSDNTNDGPFGMGWTYNQDSILRMYSAFNMGEVRINGSTREYNFIKDDPNAYITSYDGDDMTNYQLDKGHYENEKGDSLVRLSRYEYVVTTAKGEKFTYYGYQAPWREGQDKREGKLIKQEDIYGNSIQYGYNSSGQLTEITDTTGRKVNITWSGNHITSIQDPSGQYTYYGYDNSGRLNKVTLPDNSTTRYEYDTSNRIIKEVNGTGEEETFSYNSDNQVTAVYNNVNSKIYEFTYGENSVTKTDALGYTWQYSVNGLYITKEIDPLKNVTTYEYDDNSNLIKVTSLTGVTKYAYDANNNKISETDEKGITTDYKYNSIWNEPLEIKYEDAVTSFEYDDKGKVVKRTNADGGVLTFGYDSKGLLVSVQDTAGGTTTFEYDDYGNAIKTIKPDGSITQYQYNILGRLIKETDQDGLVTELEYDLSGRVVRTVTGTDKIYEYDYDEAGRLSKVTDPLGNISSYEYDAAGYIHAFTDILGRTYVYGYDLDGRIITVEASNGEAVSYEYDELGRLLKTTDEAGVTEYSYGKYGITQVKNKYGTFTYNYDTSGNLVSITDIEDRSISYQYDAMGRLMKITDPIGRTMKYEYDILGRTTKETGFDGVW